jgi:hypothetical protein
VSKCFDPVWCRLAAIPPYNRRARDKPEPIGERPLSSPLRAARSLLGQARDGTRLGEAAWSAVNDRIRPDAEMSFDTTDGFGFRNIRSRIGWKWRGVTALINLLLPQRSLPQAYSRTAVRVFCDVGQGAFPISGRFSNSLWAGVTS